MKWLLMIVGLLALGCDLSTQQQHLDRPTSFARRLHWETDVDVASQRATSQHKPMLMYFYNDYCQWCNASNNVFQNFEIEKLVNNSFIGVKLNTEIRTPFIVTVDIHVVPFFAIVIPSDAGGDVVAWRSGYMTIEQMQDFLNKAITP
jgi:thioredoxin-related protein